MKTETDKPYMTKDQAEEIVMAAELGMFRGTASEIAHARLLLARRDELREEPKIFGGK